MIDREHPLPLVQQRRILSLSRSGVYYTPAPLRDRDRQLMEPIDRIHLEEPYWGTRGIRNELWNRGHNIGRGHVRTLMRKMGIEAIYQKPRLSKPHPGHAVHPYLLKGLTITEGQRRLVRGYHLHSHGERLLLPRGRHGLGKQEGPLLETLQHARSFVLHRGPRGGTADVWNAGHIQYRSGQPVHLRRFYEDLEGPQYQDQHGLPRPVDGQYFH